MKPIHYAKAAGWTLAILMAACASKTDQPTLTKSAGGTSVAPSGTDAAKRDQALVRFVNADPTMKALDLWFGDAKIFSASAYHMPGEYVEIPAEIRKFKVRTAGSDLSEPLADNAENVMSGRRYTLVFWRDDKAKPHLQAISDDLKTTEAGKARVRIIHAAPSMHEVDVAQSGAANLFSGVDVGDATSYSDITPFNGMLQVRRSGKKSPTYLTTGVNIEAGKSYTIVLVPSGPAKQNTPVVIVDQLT